MGLSSIMGTMGDESVRDINAPGFHRGIVVERAIIQRRKIQTGHAPPVLGSAPAGAVLCAHYFS